MNRSLRLMRLASKGKAFSVLAWYDEQDGKFGAFVDKGAQSVVYSINGAWKDFAHPLESAGVKIKPGQTIAQLVGTTASKYLSSQDFQQSAE